MSVELTEYEQKLKTFVKKNNLEYKWDDDDVYLFIDIKFIKKWMDFVYNTLEYDHEYHIDCKMEYTYFSFQLRKLCSFIDIDIDYVFDKD